MLNIAICDDDRNACDYLAKYLRKFSEEFQIEVLIKVFYQTEKLKETLDERHVFDIIFLDIEFNGMNGIELGTYIRKTLNNHVQQIVYISGFDSYDRQLFDSQPFNFIAKPFAYDKLRQIMCEYIRIYGTGTHFYEYRIHGQLHKIEVEKIVYFQSSGRKIRILSVDKNGVYRTIEYYDKISNILDKVSRYRFLLIHKSYLVHYRYIIDFSYDSVKMINGQSLSVSQSKRKNVREKRLMWESE